MIEEFYITGAVGHNCSFGIIAELKEEDEPLDTMLIKFWYFDKWVAEVEVDFKAVDIAPVPNTLDAFIIIGMDGEVGWISNAFKKPDIKIESIKEYPLSARTCIIPYQDTLVCTGMGRDTYEFNGSSWEIIGTNSPQDEKGNLVGFEALHAFDQETLYAAGWKGEIWKIHKKTWKKIDSPTNLILTDITSINQKEVYFSGKNGLIIKSIGNNYAILDTDNESSDFWSIVHFKHRTFISSLYALYEIIGDKLTPVDDTEDALTFYKLSANDSIMISVGSSSIIKFDGVMWESII